MKLNSTNLNSQLIPGKNLAREYILRSIERDEDFIGIISYKFLNLFESFSDCFDYNFPNLNSDKLESLSKLSLYFISYFLNKNKQTPGEEYCEISKNFLIFHNNKKFILYLISYSFFNLFKKFFYDFCKKKINNLQNKIHENSILINKPLYEKNSCQLHIAW